MGHVTFKMLDNGEWGICGPAEKITPGAKVQVFKRSGESKTVTAGKIVESVNGVVTAAIKAARRYSGPRPSWNTVAYQLRYGLTNRYV